MVGYHLDDGPNLYKGNGCFTKHPFRTGCLGHQAEQHFDLNFVRPKDASLSRRGDDVAVAEDWSEPMEKQYSKRSVSFCAVFLFWLSLPW